jgi:hypothetical protein
VKYEDPPPDGLEPTLGCGFPLLIIALMIALLLGVIICTVGASSTKMGFYTLHDWLNVIFLLISDLTYL